ncbi:MAG TPA: 50S ribosomal protein L15 [Gammaproteobacteria bacterium]|nr:50S ribosomal protein L15 [Gammaproteobacteria bacterium]
MRLNSLRPAPGSKTVRFRVGRGIGTGIGKTCGKGHKGQRARAGGYHKVGFEGGQMPMQRRLPKSGFRSRARLAHQELRLSQLNKLEAEVIDFALLKEAAVIKSNIKTVKLVASGELEKKVTVRGIPMTKGAKAAIEALGGKVES